MKNSKELQWTTSDYFRTIALFVGQALTLAIIFLGALAFKLNGTASVPAFFSDKANIIESAYIVLAVVLLSVLIYAYFYSEKRSFLKRTSNILMIFSILNVSIISCFLLGQINMYLRPFALCALLSLILIDKRTAVFLNCVFCIVMLLCDMFVLTHTEYNREIYITLIINFISGILAVFIVDGKGSRAKVLASAFLISLPVIVSAICLEFTTNVNKLAITALWALGSGILADGLMMLLLPFFELIFGVLTNFRLSELTDHKSKLVKCLIELAPGTFNHTIIVAMLAEACSNAINENPLLARACAYYHDIGKIKKPEYFTENQSGRNPHDELLPELSTDIIRAHAKDGYDLIKKWRLPEVLADSASQHHGTMPIRYFYMKASKFTDGDLNIDQFCYYGPKPQTKINAIIMICDACEAKVRTVGNRTHENVDKAVKEIIEERMDMDQFTDCDITFKELDVIRNTITNTLAGVYHERVKYPKLKTGNKNGKNA